MSLCQTGFMETVRIAGRHSRLTACETDACTLDILDILMTCLETEVRKMMKEESREFSVRFGCFGQGNSKFTAGPCRLLGEVLG